MFPTSKKEIEALGWDAPDIILFSGDAFIDHPAFGTAVIARVLESAGYRVAVVPQPNWRDDLRDFRKLGEPKLFFGVSSGAMDSMVNHYTAAKRLRSNDAYTPGGKSSFRPDYAVTVYTRILKELFPHIPVVIGGIEASLRRLTHYDYWQDALKPSILIESEADLLIYGMGERPIRAVADLLSSGAPVEALHSIPQVGYLTDSKPTEDHITLASFERCKADKREFAANFKIFEEQSNRLEPKMLVEKCGERYVYINAPYPPATEQEMDAIYALPFTKQPHPRYRGKHIPAYEMIKHSVTTHRGCFGGCNFCTISAHQGKFIQSRTPASIIAEIERLATMPDFKGNITDLGAPTANMYRMRGRDRSLCEKCKRDSCLFPSRCENMDTSHKELLSLYDKVLKVPGVKNAYISSGIRYDLFLDEDGYLDPTSKSYLEQLITKHTSGRLKVAPEHTCDHVLKVMGKPSFRIFEKLRQEFDAICYRNGLKYQLVPYFISGHPGCRMEDMENLSRNPHLKNLYMEQVQDFTPTPMTRSSVMFYTGIDPKNGKSLFVERNLSRKKRQKSFFFQEIM